MASLLIKEPDSGERCILLAGHRLLSVGRDDQCTIQILDPEVSRRHLQIRHDDKESRHYAADYRSANGVFVNGERVVRDVALAHGDSIEIGRTKLVYVTGDHDTAEEARKTLRKVDEWKRSTLLRPE